MVITDQVMKKVTSLLNESYKPTLHALAYALRHPEVWPKGFHWNYSSCETCAMGLALELWEPEMAAALAGEDDVGDHLSKVARLLAMPYTDAKWIFQDDKKWAPKIERKRMFGLLRPHVTFTLRSEITPDMVADEIDRYLERDSTE